MKPFCDQLLLIVLLSILLAPDKVVYTSSVSEDSLGSTLSPVTAEDPSLNFTDPAEEEEAEDVMDPDSKTKRSASATHKMLRKKLRKQDRMNSRRNRERNRDNDCPLSEDYSKFSNEYRIKKKIMHGYDKYTRPVRNDSSTTTVSMAMSLFHILDTNERYQTLSALVSIRQRWTDEYLRWNASEFDGVAMIWIPAPQIWTPDIVINNFADDSYTEFQDTNAIVHSNGDVLYMYPAVVKTYCTLNVKHFPFDRQKCKIIFISWTFNGFKVDVTYNPEEKNSVYYTPRNQEWYVDEITTERHVKIYACCVEPYPDVTITIHMTRRSLFYIINLIFPCLLIYAVSFLGFFLPIQSGEKVNLETTILLALVVFLLIVGETLPPTPDAIPALGLLFGCTMLMVSIALVMAVIVTNLYLRKDSSRRVPFCVRKTFLRHKRRTSYCSAGSKPSENHVINNINKEHDIELDNLSLQSDTDNLTCRKYCRTRAESSIRPDLETQARYAHEWVQLARVVDRCFFWVFLLASIVALTCIFSGIPSFNAT